ncbi:MAG TPA: F0F1 ATP synthase subunit A [Caldilineaceae bacterium]|nr:F0F1 ATP synthase subunit A [Caldilineaceae bacterium]
MEMSPDTRVYWAWGILQLNATILYTWVAMAVLLLLSWLATRNVTSGTALSPWQNALEAVVELIEQQIRDWTGRKGSAILPFAGTLFLFIATVNILSLIPGYRAPTGSLSTTAALATCVFVAVPIYGVAKRGLRRYLRSYIQPSVFMLPFNIIGEISRTLALAVRLFGNVMSGDMIVAILLGIVPLFFPIVMQLLGLLIGFIQAYIFAVLATVYIASATAEDGEA